MSKQTINNVISLEIPDSFQLMSSEELRDMSKNGGDPYRWGVRDRENHVLITVMWKEYSVILAWLADLKAIAKKNEQMTGKAYGKHEYRLLGFDSLKAGETKADGYRFSYSVEGIQQIVTNYLIKNGKTVYAFMCVGREENMATDLAMFRSVMESLRFM